MLEWKLPDEIQHEEVPRDDIPEAVRVIMKGVVIGGVPWGEFMGTHQELLDVLGREKPEDLRALAQVTLYMAWVKSDDAGKREILEGLGKSG